MTLLFALTLTVLGIAWWYRESISAERPASLLVMGGVGILALWRFLP